MHLYPGSYDKLFSLLDILKGGILVVKSFFNIVVPVYVKRGLKKENRSR